MLELEPEGVYVGLSDVDAIGELAKPLRPLSDTEASTSSLRRFAHGDLLLAHSKGGPRVWLADRHGGCSSSFLVLRPTGRLDPTYLKWYLRVDRVARALRRR